MALDPHRKTTHIRARLITAAAILFWLAVWQGVSAAIGQEILLVSPVSVLVRLVQLMGEGAFWCAIGFSLGRIYAGFMLALLSASLLAGVAYRFSWVRLLVAPPIFAVKSTPVASFVILALVWVSSRNLSVLISFLMVFPIVYLSLLEGLENTDSGLLEMARVFRFSPWSRLVGIFLPQCTPYFLSACRVSLGLCWKSGIAAEVIGLPYASIGEKLYQTKIFLQTSDLFAWTVTIVAVSAVFERLFLYLANLLGKAVSGVSQDKEQLVAQQERSR